MEFGTLLVLLLVLACPLMMVWMMRGGHGGHSHASHEPGHAHMHTGESEVPGGGSIDELHRRRAELDAEIAELEEAGIETKTPTAV